MRVVASTGARSWPSLSDPVRHLCWLSSREALCEISPWTNRHVAIRDISCVMMKPPPAMLPNKCGCFRVTNSAIGRRNRDQGNNTPREGRRMSSVIAEHPDQRTLARC